MARSSGDVLAIHGGEPVRRKTWYDNITTGEEEKRAVKRVMDGGYLSLFEGSHTPDAPFSFLGGPSVQQHIDNIEGSRGWRLFNVYRRIKDSLTGRA